MSFVDSESFEAAAITSCLSWIGCSPPNRNAWRNNTQNVGTESAMSRNRRSLSESSPPAFWRRRSIFARSSCSTIAR